MSIPCPCYSRYDYYGYFNVDYSDKRVLDIGGSSGSFKKSGEFSEADTALREAREYVSFDVNPDSGADVIGDAHNLPFEDGEFDIIIANNLIEHLYGPEKAIAEMRRVLSTKGVVYFTIPFLHPVHEAPNDFVRFTRFGLERLFDDFQDIEILSRGGIFSTITGYVFVATRVLDKVFVGGLIRVVLYPFAWLLVKLDRFDTSEAFVRSYYGRAVK